MYEALSSSKCDAEKGQFWGNFNRKLKKTLNDLVIIKNVLKDLLVLRVGILFTKIIARRTNYLISKWNVFKFLIKKKRYKRLVGPASWEFVYKNHGSQDQLFNIELENSLFFNDTLVKSSLLELYKIKCCKI